MRGPVRPPPPSSARRGEALGEVPAAPRRRPRASAPRCARPFPVQITGCTAPQVREVLVSDRHAWRAANSPGPCRRLRCGRVCDTCVLFQAGELALPRAEQALVLLQAPGSTWFFFLLGSVCLPAPPWPSRLPCWAAACPAAPPALSVAAFPHGQWGRCPVVTGGAELSVVHPLHEALGSGS